MKQDQETLGRYLKRERETHHVTVEEIALFVRVKRSLADALEADDFDCFSRRLECLRLVQKYIIYGYVYHQLAIVIAAFMTGIALGSWQAVRRPPRRPMGALAATQIVGALAPLALCLIFNALAPSTFASQVLFPVMALASGAIGGYQFPVAAGLFGSPGTLYALDLAGSCAGAILFSVWLVPLFGFLKTALLMAAVNLAPAALAVDGARRTPAR